MDAENTGNQERNIMILFLSEVHYDTQGDRKIFDDDKKKEDTTYNIYESIVEGCIETNEAPLRDVLEYLKKNPREEVEHRSLDAIFYFVSNKVKNCDKDGNPLKKFDIYAKKEDAEPKWTDIASDEEFFWTERAEKLTGSSFPKAISMDDISSKQAGGIWRIPVAFNDDPAEDPVKSSTDAVRAMEEAIRKYLTNEKVPWDRCNIYADTTGGFRPANMAMSAVIQLLVYQGAKLRRVVYSEWKARKVSDVQPINDMYRLVAGVDAFRRYGSSAELNEYFKGVEYQKLQELLNAMNAFSESVLLCQPNDIEKNLAALMDALGKFPKEPEAGEKRPAKVELFARMLDDLKKLYSPMYYEETKETDRLAIIKWCVDNTLFQQAATFCTEWLPEYFVDWGVLYTDDLAVQRYCNMPPFPDYRPWNKNLIMQFCTQNVSKEDKGKTGLDKITDRAVSMESPKQIRKLIANVAEQKHLELDLTPGEVLTSTRWSSLPDTLLSPMKLFLENIEANLNLLKNPNSKPLSSQMKRTKRLLSRIYDKEWKQQEIHTLILGFFQYLYRCNLVEHESFWGITDREYRYTGNYVYDPNAAKEYQEAEMRLHGDMRHEAINAAAVTRAMLDCGLLKTDLETDEAVHHIREYTYIRARLRNKMNHVSEEESKDNLEEYVKMTIPAIGDYLDRYLGEIFALRKKLASPKDVHPVQEATP